MLREFPVKVPVGVGFAKRSGLVREGTPDEFEALAGRCRVFRFDPDGLGHRLRGRALHHDVAGAGPRMHDEGLVTLGGSVGRLQGVAHLPEPVRKSSWAAVPSAMPSSTSPLLVCTETAPLTAVATVTSPDAVCALTLPCSRSTHSDPLAARNLTSPPSSPIVASPDAVDDRSLSR